ncbi:MAG: hypothetical protein IT582_06020 [Opitutaceae bacterium]|nr:hypothetical protein [Opitutaceae bacterium]
MPPAPTWRFSGSRVTVNCDPVSLALSIATKANRWRCAPSQTSDLTVRVNDQLVSLRLADATQRTATPYETGYSHGLRVTLSGWQHAGAALDLTLDFFLTLEGPDEDLVAQLNASDGAARVHELRWPGAIEPADFDHTVTPSMQGMLLPKAWPAKAFLLDSLCFGRGLYLPCWGHQQGRAALLTILETPNDAGCDFAHPPGGPTRLGPRWVASLKRWTYPRRVRFCLLDRANHVGLAKRYRRHVIEHGRFVSLREKIARNPRVAALIGAPVIHTGILTHISPASDYYSKTDPAKNHIVTPFAQRAKELRALHARGVRRAYVHLDGWGLHGYDNLHPDPLPPAPEAGGWRGFKLLADTCDELGYTFAIHDQYRDYYHDAPSYNPAHTVIDENGQHPFCSIWYGGPHSFLCPSHAPGHVRKNHRAMLAKGVKLRGAYLDVFSVVPPDECHASEHPVTRTECLRLRTECFNFVRSYGGVVSSEEPSDWSAPSLDLVHHGPWMRDPNPGEGTAVGIPIPFFDLVYHDALLLPWSLERGAWGIPPTDLGYLHGMAHAGLPYLSITPTPAELRQVRAMCAINQRLALTELTGHAFIGSNPRRQRFTYADGTQITLDLDADHHTVSRP